MNVDAHFFCSAAKGKVLLKKDKLDPIKIYSCGVTTYDDIHLGHLRSAAVADLLVRFLKEAGYKTIFVKNFTDIDDKIINRAKESDINWQELSKTMIEKHNRALAPFKFIEPNFSPKVTENIPQIIKFIEELQKRDLAYLAEGDVYFKTRSAKNYGKFSSQKIDQLLAGARVEVNDVKNDPLDFALWKKSAEGAPGFESPWGLGRPGWHIECSAMIYDILGEEIDIHLGGTDLLFPHHENEIAQSEALTGKKLSKFWLHHELVRTKNQKMSKSLGNFAYVSEMLKKFNPKLIIYYLHTTHYRSYIDYTDEAIINTAEGLDRLYAALPQGNELNDSVKLDEEKYLEFLKCLADDLNSPQALAIMFGWVKEINRQKNPTPRLKLQQTLFKAMGSLNILEPEYQTWLNSERVIKETKLDVAEIEAMVRSRNQARRELDWVKADEIRNELLKLKVSLFDDGEKTTWQRTN